MLLSVPNVSEGRRPDVIEAIGGAFAPARVLRVHSDPDHGRSVYSLVAPQGEL
ncbi:MAG: Formiminotransferase domain, N-terminal subdomain, partial [Thermoleophilaceae bacterium]|nr:Formiminotransferase domain, N-terminal subdomain [Thermoleophilaceae bacterium]